MSSPDLEPEDYPEDRPRAATIRSRLMLEIASELVGFDDWEPKQARIQLRRQGASEWVLTLFGSDAPSAIHEVSAGRADFAIINPAAVAAVARAGLAPFESPVDLRAIATIPSYDQLGFAVAEATGIRTFSDLADHEGPLRISLRGERPDHSVHMVVEHTLSALGTSLQGLSESGATINYDPGLPHQPTRAGAMAGGGIDAVFDEGIYNWVDQAIAGHFRFLSLPDEAMARLTEMGYRPATLSRSRYPNLPVDVTTVDFSGFMVYTHGRVSRPAVRSFCAALEARSDRIPWQAGPSLPLDRMLHDAADAPLPIPFHPAAADYWHERGYLTDPIKRSARSSPSDLG